MNPRQKQKLLTLYPFELFRIIVTVVLNVFKWIHCTSKYHQWYDSCWTGKEYFDKFYLPYFSVDCFDGRSVYTQENPPSSTPYKLHWYFLQVQEESVIVSHIDVDSCSLEPAIANNCKAMQVQFFFVEIGVRVSIYTVGIVKFLVISPIPL